MTKRLAELQKLVATKTKPIAGGGVALQLKELRKDLADVMTFCSRTAKWLEVIIAAVEEHHGKLEEPDWGGE